MSDTHALVVCTYNRRNELQRCLESLLPQLRQEELIVIDDGSTDDTAHYLESLPHHEGLKIIRVSNQGLSTNRDLGAQESTATWITYVDDDAWAPHDWLNNVREACANQPPNVAALGGPVKLPWTGPPPSWLPPKLRCYLTEFSPSRELFEHPDTMPYVGTNMTLNRDWLERIGGFASNLGRRGSNLLSREETQLWNRLRALGARGHHAPVIWLWHDLPASRLNQRWFLRRLYWEGVSLYIETASKGEPKRPLPSRCLRAIRPLIQTVLTRLPRWLFAPDAQSRFQAMIDISFQFGATRAAMQDLNST
jgi:glycosyltransferase involved in cell wall biosynthesis